MEDKLLNKIICGDALEELKKMPDGFIDMSITSPPYWGLRDYGNPGQLGLEPTFEEYIDKLCNIFDEVKRVLKGEGTCWVNLGDTYGGTKKGNTETGKNPNVVTDTFTKSGGVEKSLCQIPSRFSIEMCNRGWILRNTIIWHKPNCMPSSAKDRFTVDFEYLFFFAKNKKYYFEQQFDPMIYPERTYNTDVSRHKTVELKNMGNRTTGGLHDGREKYGDPEKGRNKRCVWKITTKPYKEAHFAVFPPELIETPIKAGCPEDGIVLDPFIGSGTTGMVAKSLNRNYLGIDIQKSYTDIQNKRLLNS